MISRSLLACAVLLSVFLSGCRYETPLTEKPTQRIDPRLLGEWAHFNTQSNLEEIIQVKEWDRHHYVVVIGDDLYRAYHSEWAGLPFLSVQDLSGSKRRYMYITANVSTDGRQLTLRTTSEQVVPEGVTGREALQKLIKANLDNPALLEAPLVFKRRDARP